MSDTIFFVCRLFVSVLLYTAGPVSLALADGSSLLYGEGGYVPDFLKIVRQYNANGEQFRIEGTCKSACTLFLGIGSVCVQRDAKLMFHAGHDIAENRTGPGTRASRAALYRYNESLRRYLLEGQPFWLSGVCEELNKCPRKQESKMRNMRTVEIKAFVPARDFALSKRFYQDLGFTLAWSDDDLAYFRHGNSSFLLQNFSELPNNFMMHLLVEDVDAWWQHVEEQKLVEKYGVKAEPPADRSWGMRDFVIVDPTYVLWRIAENK